MTKNEIYEEVTKIFQEVFDDDELEICSTTTADDIDDWDSLEQINLIVLMEKKFSIKFNLQEVSALENVGGIVDLIEQKIG